MDRVSNLEDKEEKNNKAEQQKEKRIKKNEDNLRNIMDYMKCNNIYIMGISEEEEREQVIEDNLKK